MEFITKKAEEKPRLKFTMEILQTGRTQSSAQIGASEEEQELRVRERVMGYEANVIVGAATQAGTPRLNCT